VEYYFQDGNISARDICHLACKLMRVIKYSMQQRITVCLINIHNIKIRIYKTILLPVTLYGCGTWSLTLREAHRLEVFENRVLRRIFGPKR
jgi:hypothetical protein